MEAASTRRRKSWFRIVASWADKSEVSDVLASYNPHCWLCRADLARLI